jgi:rare lipoprotein A
MTRWRLRQHCGERCTLALRNLSILMAMVALPLTSHAASAQSASERVSPWVGEKGVASVYSNKYHGRRTAMGTRFDQHMLTAAHPWLPLGSRVRVTSASTGESVIVTVTDRMRARHRVIDLSAAAARLLGMIQPGLMQVTLSPAI